MASTESLLRQLAELMQASVRLQKFSIVLQAEALARQVATAAGATSPAAVDRLVVRAVKQMRATVERVSAGRALPK